MPCCFCSAACEDTDIRLAAEAGLDAVTAVTLSDQAVQELARQSAAYADDEHVLAPAESVYARRLQNLVGDHLREEGVTFNYGVCVDGRWPNRIFLKALPP